MGDLLSSRAAQWANDAVDSVDWQDLHRRSQASFAKVRDPMVALPPSLTNAQQNWDAQKKGAHAVADAMLMEPGWKLGGVLQSIAEGQATFGDYANAAANIAGAIPAGAAAKAVPAMAGLLGLGVGGGLKSAAMARNVSLDHLKGLIDGGAPLYARWSRGPRFDMNPAANSRDYVSGISHEGLSAIELGKDEPLENILRSIRDYSFLRSKDEKIRPHIYEAKRIGTDTDNAPLIRPIKHIGSGSDKLLQLLDDATIDRMSIMESIRRNERALEIYKTKPPDYIPVWTEGTLATNKKKLDDLGGPVVLPNDLFRLK